MFNVLLSIVALISFVVWFVFFGLMLNKHHKMEKEERRYAKGLPFTGWCSFGVGLLCVLIITAFSIKVVGQTEVLTRACFGERDMEFSEGAGFKIVSPYCSYTAIDVSETSYKFETYDDLSNAPLTADSVKMDTVINFPVSINGDFVNELLAEFKTKDKIENNLILNSYWDAIRRTVSQFYWSVPKKEEQLAGKKYLYIDAHRDEMSEALKANFNFIIKKKLLESGFDEDIAERAFVVGYGTISKLLPPDTISKAINEQKKADSELKRQATITAIEAEKANRGAQEGARIKNLLESIFGKDYKPEDKVVVSILNAYANVTDADANALIAKAEETKADAIEKGVEKDTINTIVIGGSPNVAVSAQ